LPRDTSVAAPQRPCGVAPNPGARRPEASSTAAPSPRPSRTGRRKGRACAIWPTVFAPVSGRVPLK